VFVNVVNRHDAGNAKRLRGDFSTTKGSLT